MKNLVFLTIMLAVALPCIGQKKPTDREILNSILGKSYSKMHHALDSLGVWYAYHHFESGIKGYDPLKDKVYSIANGDGTVKVWILELTEAKIVREVMINFRHDSKEQVEDSKRVGVADDYKNGYYSTDMVFRWKKP